MQWHLGNTFIRIDHLDTSEPRDGGGFAAAGMPFSWVRHNIRCARIPLRKSKNIDSIHFAGDQCRSLCNAGNALGEPTQNTFDQYVTA